MPKKSELPTYITHIYPWLYTKISHYKLLNNSTLLNILTLGYHNILTTQLKKEIAPQTKILQIGLTLGDQMKKTSQSTGMLGSFTVLDINSELINYHKEKQIDLPIEYIAGDASVEIKEQYDCIICYMLLHELPPTTQSKILNNIISALKENGKAIFIDYNQPSMYNPLKYFIRAFNRLYQPFAEILWKKSIKELTPNSHLCSWTKQTYFGGIYQKVVATKN